MEKTFQEPHPFPFLFSIHNKNSNACREQIFVLLIPRSFTADMVLMALTRSYHENGYDFL